MKRILFLAAIVAVTAAAARNENGIVHASVDQRASHDGLYQVQAHPQADGTWTFDVRDDANAQVENAKVYAYAAMPLTGIADSAHWLARETNAGVYSVDSLRTNVTGWWNVKLRISSEIGVDSVAFNVTVR
jgi:hypothetical protein